VLSAPRVEVCEVETNPTEVTSDILHVFVPSLAIDANRKLITSQFFHAGKLQECHETTAGQRGSVIETDKPRYLPRLQILTDYVPVEEDETTALTVSLRYESSKSHAASIVPDFEVVLNQTVCIGVTLMVRRRRGSR